MSARATVLRRLAPPARLRSSLTPSPQLRRRIVAALAAFALLAALYMLWLRDSSLVAVDSVAVTGATTDDAGRVRTALTNAAQDMTTLHVDEQALLDAVAAFPVVKGIEVDADFPSALKITVIEHRPAAVLSGDGPDVAVAGDGTLLRGVPTSGLPELTVPVKLAGQALAAGPARNAALIAGAVPEELRGRVESVGRRGGRGFVVPIEDGPEIIFGTAERVGAKWAAATRVLADPDAGGAEYIDVRLPERPAAGGLAVETVAPVPVEPLDGTAPAEPLAPAEPVDPAAAEQAPVEPVEPAPVAPEPVTPAEPVEPLPEAGGGAVVSPQP